MAFNFSNWTLRNKLLLAFIFVGLLPLALGGFITHTQSNGALRTAAFNQLESIRDAKRRELRDYFTTFRNQVLTLSESPTTVFAMDIMRKGFHNDRKMKAQPPEYFINARSALRDYYQNQYNAEYQKQNSSGKSIETILPKSDMEVYRQYRYIADNPHPLGEKHLLDHAPLIGEQYDRLHRKYHPFYRSYLEKFGYYDIVLVDADTGHIVYSVSKEIDYATSLLTGPYKDSSLANAFRRARDAGDPNSVILEDYKPYGPSYGAAASFIASPIFEKSKLIGVLIFQMPAARINAVMTQNSGLGKSGETYLIGSDRLMRSQSQYIDSETIGKIEIDTVAVNKVIAGKTGQQIISNYQGTEVLSSYTPIEVEGLNWGLIAEVDSSEAFAAEWKLQITFIVIGLVAIAVVLSITYLLLRNVGNQLGGDPMEIKNIAEAIADNDLSMELKAPDQATGVYSSMSRMRDNLKESIERDRELAAESSRIKQALDSSSTNVMVADAENTIIYINDALIDTFSKIEDDICDDLPGFRAANLLGANIDQFHKNPAHQNKMLERLKSSHKAELLIGGHTMSLAVNPIIDDDNQRLGTVVEWHDRSVEVAIQNDIEQLILATQDGDLSQRIDLTGKQGFFQTLSKGMNELLETTSQVFDQIASVMSALSEGDLKRKMEGDHSGTFEQVQENVNTTIESLRGIVNNIRSSTNLITTGSDEISSGNNSLSSRTEQQAASLEETASAMEGLTSTVRQNADYAQQANQLADTARQTAQEGGSVVSNAVMAMEEINHASNKIAEIIGVIDDIAFQTNLLALNASVEAARAGEQGRGFAVVATEVRNLAQRSATAAKEIKDLIQDSVNKVSTGTDLVNESGEALENIVNSVIKVGDIVAEIATASQEQATGIDQVNNTVSNLDDLTQQNAALAEETSAASVAMNQRAREMVSLIDFFKLEYQSTNTVTSIKTANNIEAIKPKPAPSAKVAIAHPDNIKAGNNDDEWEEF